MNTENLQKIIALRHELHEYPELSMNETQTKRRLMSFLEANTKLAVIDCGKWFYASHYVEGTKAIAFRADMDALPIDEGINIQIDDTEAKDFRADMNTLPVNKKINLPYASRNPGVSHKCGHDGHCAALCGLGLELEDIDVKRSVYLIFQHAEETGQGARECANLLRERSISEIYTFHNWSGWPEKSIVVREGLCQCASAGLTIKFTGKTSHASEPEKGINPAYSIAKLISEIEAVSQKYSDRKILCTIINIKLGEKNFGISPGEGELSLTLRAEREDDMRTFRNAVVKLAENLARENSLLVEVSSCDYFPETLSDKSCVGRVRTAAKTLGLKVIDMPEAIRASEDFGFYTKLVHGAIFYVGNGESYPAIHTRDYDFNDEILASSVDMFAEIYRQFAS
ncbi:MAG: M20/M25/M40 family metallo-hydrolase [Synergistaceae bacterium]|nr:M20/M25/M40 family metallo-hydrolase [Synergistaceae bacterium]